MVKHIVHIDGGFAFAAPSGRNEANAKRFESSTDHHESSIFGLRIFLHSLKQQLSMRQIIRNAIC